MAPKNPLDRIAARAVGSIKDPKGTADKVYAQAKGATSVARHLAGAFGQFAVSKATETAGTLAERATARRAGRRGPGLRPVPDVNEPAAPVPSAATTTEPAPQEEPAAPAASAAPATPADVAKAVKKAPSAASSDKGPGDKLPPPKKPEPAQPASSTSSGAPSGSTAKKTTGKSTAKKATGKKSASKKSTAKKSTAKKATGNQRGASTKKSPRD